VYTAWGCVGGVRYVCVWVRGGFREGVGAIGVWTAAREREGGREKKPGRERERESTAQHDSTLHDTVRSTWHAAQYTSTLHGATQHTARQLHCRGLHSQRQGAPTYLVSQVHTPLHVHMAQQRRPLRQPVQRRVPHLTQTQPQQP
jgi:hypothetical protein